MRSIAGSVDLPARRGNGEGADSRRPAQPPGGKVPIARGKPMSSRPKAPAASAPPHFPEAVAQWRLALRTEVKSTSSLPSSVFHARDSMLESLLAETTEGMLTRLLEPGPDVARASAGPGEERAVESVTADELRTLPRRLGGLEQFRVDVDDHLVAEGLAVLTDACTTGSAAVAAAAAEVLRRQFGATADADPAALALQLARGVQAASADRPGAEAELASLCQRLVTILAAQPGHPPHPAGPR
jgi:hypothetical protein